MVYLADRPPTGELEACPAGDLTARFHTGVHHRSTPNGWAWTAVFPEVTEGRYQLLHVDGVPMADLAVTGGSVHELDLR